MRNVVQSIETPKDLSASNSSAERRKLLRVRTYLPVSVEIVDESGESSALRAVATDVAVEGLKLKSTSFQPEVGQTVRVNTVNALGSSGTQLGAIHCQVLWVQRTNREILVGLRYADNRDNMLRSWVRYLLQELGFDEKCTFQRQRFADGSGIPARIHAYEQSDPGPQSAEGKVCNLGVSGALLETKAEFKAGEAVEVELSLWRILPRLKVRGQVVEVKENANQRTYLHSIQFGIIPGQDMRLLGNYVINQLNQACA